MINYNVTVLRNGELEGIFTTTDFWTANNIIETVSADPDVEAWIQEEND